MSLKPFYEDEDVLLYHGDCREILPQLAAGSAHCIITDPPYNVSVKNGDFKNLNFKYNGQSAGRRYFGDWDFDFNPSAVISELNRNLYADGQLYVFSGDKLVEKWLSLVNESYSKTRLLTWAKPDPLPNIRQREWCSATEHVIWAARGKYFFNYQAHAKMYSWSICQSPKRQRFHPTQKPLELILKYVAVSTLEQQVILDPFAGAGTTLLAAKQSGRKAVGIEQDEEYCRLTARRLRAVPVFPLLAEPNVKKFLPESNGHLSF